MSKVKGTAVSADIQAIIDAAVERAYEKGMTAGKIVRRQERTPFQRTEARLYALPALVRKVESDIDELERLEAGARLPERSKDLTRFTRGGVRVSPEDQLEAVIRETKAEIASDEYEIKSMRRALEEIKDELYYPIITAKYFEKLSDDEIATKIPCDPSTVRRQKNRLVGQLAVFLYGAQALE